VTRNVDADVDDDVEEPVYAPQHDSRLLCELVRQSRPLRGLRVADLCTGSGVVAIEAGRVGAASVAAFDISPAAVRRSRSNARAAGVDVDVRLGSWSAAIELGPFDVVTCNPPYVPQPPGGGAADVPRQAGPARAFDAGADGRLVLDPLCRAAPDLLANEGTMLIVQSEFSGVDESLAILRDGGLKASVVVRRWIPFGPVLAARAAWLERTGLLQPGRRVEELVAIRVDVP
jgi:release factor glutamine methyltransferase